MEKMRVIIVNWNAGSQLRECVDSIIQYGQSLVGQIVVVDNGSTDGSASVVADLPQVTLVQAGANLGFGKACNLGAAHADSDFVLFLNPDARLFPDSLTRIVDFMRRPENAQVGICGVQLVDEDGHVARSCTRFPTTIGFVAHAVGLDRIIPTLGHFMGEWDHATTRQVDHVIGAFFLVRQSVFNALDGFDERYFVYLEDLDFSYRARQLGWSSVYLAEAQAFHAGGGTSRQVKARRLFYSLRSRILYAFKHFNPLAAILVLFATICIEPLSRSLLAVGRLSYAALKETWSAYGMLIRWLPDWIFKGKTR
jgi:GT2 family glycosyltransferase